LLDAFSEGLPVQSKAELVRARRRAVDESGLERNPRRARWLFRRDFPTAAMFGGGGPAYGRALSDLPERDAFISEFKDPQGYWTGIFVNNLVLLLQHQNDWRQGCAQKNYPDLLDPKWKDKMLMDSTDLRTGSARLADGPGAKKKNRTVT